MLVSDARPFDDNERQTELHRGRELRIGATDHAAVLRDDDIRLVLLVEFFIEQFRERSLQSDDMARTKAERHALHDNLGIGQDTCCKHAILQGGRFLEYLQIVTARREEDILSQGSSSLRCFLIIRDIVRLRIIERCTLPFVADVGNAACTASAHGIFRNVHRIGMARVNEDGNIMPTAIGCKGCFIQGTVIDRDARIARKKLFAVAADDRRRDLLSIFQQEACQLPAILRAGCHKDHTS